MNTADYNYYQSAAWIGLIPDSENPVFLFSQTHKDLLLDIVSGKIDAVELAKIELRNRGLDVNTGKWIGWPKENVAI